MTTFEMSQNKHYLEAALKQGLDAPYSCQGGICSSCLARVNPERQKWQKTLSLQMK
jgi:ring-1,2-phenylacetyl-CoA epoxidase subunit PaaE